MIKTRYTISIVILIALISCASEKNSAENTAEKKESTKEIVFERPQEIQESKEETPEIPKIEEKVENSSPILEESQEDFTKNYEPIDEEYARSVGEVEVDKDTFEFDKATILQKIKELSIIMEKKQYKKWLTFVDSQSVSYWTKPINLRKASARLSVKGFDLKSLEDYFKFVFIPARKGHFVEEIRYISENFVKVVSVKNDSDLIFYYFKKENNEWKINLPPLED